mmetsp:Transcript_4633/g.17420  ORF Transcript_4633/g.17420 Transcript_4633/m.17420 type:complete len:273 (-) Transcript_4633:157-975(-)
MPPGDGLDVLHDAGHAADHHARAREICERLFKRSQALRREGSQVAALGHTQHRRTCRGCRRGEACGIPVIHGDRGDEMHASSVGRVESHGVDGGGIHCHTLRRHAPVRRLVPADAAEGGRTCDGADRLSAERNMDHSCCHSCCGARRTPSRRVRGVPRIGRWARVFVCELRRHRFAGDDGAGLSEASHDNRIRGQPMRLVGEHGATPRGETLSRDNVLHPKQEAAQGPLAPGASQRSGGGQQSVAPVGLGQQGAHVGLVRLHAITTTFEQSQ